MKQTINLLRNVLVVSGIACLTYVIIANPLVLAVILGAAVLNHMNKETK